MTDLLDKINQSRAAKALVEWTGRRRP